jgi:hypothetical protein
MKYVVFAISLHAFVTACSGSESQDMRATGMLVAVAFLAMNALYLFMHLPCKSQRPL